MAWCSGGSDLVRLSQIDHRPLYSKERQDREFAVGRRGARSELVGGEELRVGKKNSGIFHDCEPDPERGLWTVDCGPQIPGADG